MPYVCIGVPYWIGEREENCAVDAIKASGIGAEIGAKWVDVDVNFGESKYAIAQPVVAINMALAEVVQQYPDHTPLIFASDCVSAIGALKGLENKNPAVLWYDAHGDFNTPETSLSGFLGGMPLAAIVGRGNEWLVTGVGLTPLHENDIIITDARDLDPEEGQKLLQSNITHLKDLTELMHYHLPQKPLYIHFDTDVVNHDEMPAMNYPAVGGPSLAETMATLERVKRDATVAGVLFSLWEQNNPGAYMALTNCLKIVRAFTKEQ